MLATVMFAHGTPMLLAGDEVARTQRGNNNAYCQDSDISWFDWNLAKTAQAQALCRFVAKLIAIRQEHRALRSRHFLHGKSEPAPGIFDISWFNEQGDIVPEESWKNPEHRLLVLRRAMENKDGTVSILSLLLNPINEDRYFRLPPPQLPGRILIDTARPDADERTVIDNKFDVLAHSAVLVYSQLQSPTS
jgi:glycogen operon protein